MNKYEKAYELISSHVEDSQENLALNYELGNALADIDELVQMTKPMVPLFNHDKDPYMHCPHCSGKLNLFEKHCFHCGQVIDWDLGAGFVTYG